MVYSAFGCITRSGQSEAAEADRRAAIFGVGFPNIGSMDGDASRFKGGGNFPNIS